MSSSPTIQKSVLIVGLEKFSMVLFQFVTSIVLARLLSPSDYGTVAMLSIFISLSGTLVDSGFGGSLIYHRDVTKKDFSTIFWMNLLMSICLYVLLILFSKTIANFYDTPILASLIKVLALTIVFNSLGQVQYSMLYKQLHFKEIAIINIVTYVISALVAIYLAYSGYGVWALITQQVLASLLRTVILIFVNRFIPKFCFSKKLLQKHWSYGSGLFFANILRIVYDNMYVQLIGKYTSIENSGFYNQAKRLKDIPTDLFSRTFTTTLFPILSKIDADSEFVIRFRNVSRIIAFFCCPIFILLSLLSNNIVVFLIGCKWLESAWIFRIISVGAIFYILETINRNALKSKGKSKLIFILDLIKRSISLIVMFVGIIRFDIFGICIAYVFNSILGWLVNAYALSKFSAYRFSVQILDVLKYMFFSVVCYCILAFMISLNFESELLSILVTSLIFCSIYIILTIITKDTTFTYLKRLIFTKLNININK